MGYSVLAHYVEDNRNYGFVMGEYYIGMTGNKITKEVIY
jgi:hypothetical protein